MKRISAVALSIVAMLLIPIITSSAHAQVTDALLPDPGILPDNQLYGLKRAFEFIWTSWTFSGDAKALRALELAQTRLAEARAMADAEKPEFVASLLHQYTAELYNANRLSASLPDDKKSVVSEKIAVATSRLIFVLHGVEDKVPENAKLAVIAAREKSMQENMQALKGLASENPERAAEIATNVANGKLKDAFEASRGGNQNEVRKALEEQKTYEDLADRIKTTAKQAEKNDSEGKEKSDNSRKTH